MKTRWVNYNQAQECFKVRQEVFVEEQGFSKEGEFDTIDSISHHLEFIVEDEVVATCRIFIEEDTQTYHCGRICVLKKCRSLGLGSKIMEGARLKVIELGGKGIELSAQVSAKPFYAKCGYTEFGGVHYDEGCPHIMMQLVFN